MIQNAKILLKLTMEKNNFQLKVAFNGHSAELCTGLFYKVKLLCNKRLSQLLLHPTSSQILFNSTYRCLVIPGRTGYQYEQIHIVMSRVVITLILLIMGSYFFCKTKL